MDFEEKIEGLWTGWNKMKHIKGFYCGVMQSVSINLLLNRSSYRAIDILILNKSLFASLFEIW